MVIWLGSSIWGCPAESSSCSSQSFTILTGQLFSVIHLTRWALKNSQLTCQSGRKISYRTSVLVWAWREWSTGCWPWCANKWKIELLVPLTSAPFVLLRTASSPKHWSAWCQRLAVEARSLESWKRCMPPTTVLHFQAAQGKKWNGRSSWCWTEMSSSLKKEYMGECQVCLRASKHNG